MTRSLALLALATIGVAAGASTAQAELIRNDVRSVNYSGYVPCANGGAGEILSGRIDIHYVVTSTATGANRSRRFLSQVQGGSMVGNITGDTYRVTGITHSTSNASLETDRSTMTYVNVFQLIGPGSGNNLLVHEVVHVTTDANDDEVVRHDELSIECR